MTFIDDGMKDKLNERLAKLQGKTVPVEIEKAVEAVEAVVETRTVKPKSSVFNLQDELKLLDKEAPFAYSFPIEFKKAMVGLKMLHNCPYEFSAIALLGYTNIATHHLYNVNSHKYGIRPSSLFLTILLQSGGLKSTIGAELSGPFNEFIDFGYGVLADEEYRYASDFKVFKNEVKQYEKDKEDGIVSDYPKSPKLAETSGYKIKKATTAGIFSKLESQPFVNIASSEGAGFFKSHAFQDETRGNETADALIDLWDGSTLSYDLKEKNYHLANRRLSMILMSQYGPIASTLSNVIFQEQGFIHRILLANIKPFKKKLMNEDNPEQDDKDDAEYRKLIKPFLTRLTELFNQRRRELDDRNFELDPIVTDISMSARQKSNAYYNLSLNWGEEGNRLSRYEGFSQRLHEHMIRIACTISAFSNNKEITELDMLSAINLMEMFIDHRVSITQGIVDLNPNLSNNSNITAKWFEDRKDQAFTTRELYKVSGADKGYIKLSPSARDKLLEELLRGEYIICTESVAKNNKTVRRYSWNNETDDEK